MKYTSFIWDFDGTLFDTHPHVAAAFEKIMDRDGISYNHAELLECLWVGTKPARERYGLTDEQYEDILKTEESFSLAPYPAPFRGAAAVLRAVCESGGKNYIYTHRNRLTWTYLKLWGLDKYFTGGVDSTMRFPAKPCPDAVLHICKVYGIDKADAVMIGDREIDVQAGVDAGCAGCLFESHPLASDETCASYRVGTMEALAAALDIPLGAGDILSVSAAEEIRKTAKAAAEELCKAAKLGEGALVVIGCSSSEITGERIGSSSSPEAAEAVLGGILDVFFLRGINIAAQCCEHLNRALIMEKRAAEAKGYERVNVIPMPKAGGAFATAAWRQFNEPVAVSHIEADAGLDIGGTLIGMHLKRVAVPLRLSIKAIGFAPLTAARVRSPFAGGERAVYDDSLM